MGEVRPVVRLLRGLPAAGKSTVARQLRAETRLRGGQAVVVGRDTVRDMAGVGWHGGPDAERLVTAVQVAAAAAALRHGADVVVDDTNLDPAYVARWQQFAARHGAGFAVHDVATDVETCVRRDAGRPVPRKGGPVSGCQVGEDVIRMLAAVRYVADTEAGQR